MKKTEAIIIHVLTPTGKVKDSHMGILTQGQAQILPNVQNLDHLMELIKGKEEGDFINTIF